MSNCDYGIRKTVLFCLCAVIGMSFPVSAGEIASADISITALAGYLGHSALATEEVTREAASAIQGGKGFRNRVRDQQGRSTLATIFVDKAMILHVTTFRTETCPECNGSGNRPAPFSAMDRVAVNLRCLNCEGKGKLERHTIERKYTLGPNDFNDREAARQMLDERAFRDAPPETRRWINLLNSSDPHERLAACRWLDKNYVKLKADFQTISPMIEKSKFFERDDKKRMLGWRFWAGRGIPGEEKHAYYTIIADARTGRIIQKGFTPER